MKEKLKEYCFEELLNIRRGWDAERAICRAQGAVMFYTNHAKDEPEEDREEIRTWWNEKMLYSMMMEKKRQKEVK